MLALAAAVLLSSAPAPHLQPNRPAAWWVPLAVSGVAIVGGVSLMLIATYQDDEAVNLTGEAADRKRYIAVSNRAAGGLILLFAACSAAVSAFLFGWDMPVSAAIAPSPGGAAFALGWRL